MAEDRYRIIKFHRNGASTKMRGLNSLTLDDAKRYCQREDTHKKDREGNVIWFCGFTKV